VERLHQNDTFLVTNGKITEYPHSVNDYRTFKKNDIQLHHQESAVAYPQGIEIADGR
tara:strand:+ start:160 stop:330 length:171 start_codon:yes stop_codon:yes gene_type:complete